MYDLHAQDMELAIEQTSKPICEFFPDEVYPEGEFHAYDNVRTKVLPEEARAIERELATDYNALRKAAETHRRVRKHIQSVLTPGMRLVDICETIENGTRRMLGDGSLAAGIAFPTGCSLNNCAAHDTPNEGDNRVLGENDVCKIDFGTHVNGNIIDSAFTVSFNPVYDPLKEASRAATYAGIKMAGVDVRLGEIGEVVQEVMEAFEVEIGGTVYPIKSIRNLCGHSIGKYHVHGGKTVPNVRGGEMTTKMEEGEVFAIETFASTGKGRIHEEGDCSHYMRSSASPPLSSIRLPRAKDLFKKITKNFGTLAFCRRYLDRIGEKRYMLSLNQLVRQGLIEPYPPLSDIQKSFTSQYEHTILLRPSGKEILSKGEDY